MREKITRNSCLFVGLLCLIGCFGDVEKNIRTDQQVEGEEIFRISLGLQEPLFFAFQPFDYYKTTHPDTIPGCPEVLLNETDRIVSLTFSDRKGCTLGRDSTRNGKIHLQYRTENVLVSTVTLQYEDYTFGGIEMIGSREFKGSSNLVNPGRRNEQFENLLVLDKNKSSSRIQGTFIHELSFQNSVLKQFVSQGTIQGRNIAGRQLSMAQETPKVFETSCTLQGSVFPSQGSEKWQITHGTGQVFSHGLGYAAVEACLSSATVRLQDGRVLLVNQ